MGSSGSQLLSMLMLPLIFSIAFVFLNASIARRKGRNPAIFGPLSIFPLVNLVLAVYLVSLPDQEMMDKLDAILKALNKEQPLKV